MPDTAIRLEITLFTDPLCCWSWAFEPQLRKLRYAYAGRLAWRNVMGAMIEDWTRYADPLNSIHRPGQMAPLWIEAGEASGMPMAADVWIDDPPMSSLPACLAVKAAEAQGAIAGDRMLRRLREAIMLEGRNIARPETIRSVAAALADGSPGWFDPARFEEDLAGAAARKALADDVKDTRFRGIGRFPTLLLRPLDGPARTLTGWHPYALVERAVQDATSRLGPARAMPDAAAYTTYWGSVTDREVHEAIAPRA